MQTAVKPQELKTIASSPTIEGVQKLINSYFLSTTYRVEPDLKIYNSKGLWERGVVVQKKGRYYFKLKSA